MYKISEVVERQYRNIDNYIEGNYGGREKSWEWCHQAFLNNKNNTKDFVVDNLALNLFAYLGSFGMFRNSKLLDCDYKVFKGLIKDTIQNKKYNVLYNIDPKIQSTNAISNLIFGDDGIYQEISEYLSKRNIKDTDTLVTKILLGTYSCLPAYDRFLKVGISFHNTYICDKDYPGFTQNSTAKNKETYKKCAEFYNKHFNELEKNNKFNYPPMKLVDMYFNELGYELDLIEALDENRKTKAQNKLISLNIMTGHEKNKKQTIRKKYENQLKCFKCRKYIL